MIVREIQTAFAFARLRREGFELRADTCLYLSPRYPSVVADLYLLEPKRDPEQYAG